MGYLVVCVDVPQHSDFAHYSLVAFLSRLSPDGRPIRYAEAAHKWMVPKLHKSLGGDPADNYTYKSLYANTFTVRQPSIVYGIPDLTQAARNSSVSVHNPLL